MPNRHFLIKVRVAYDDVDCPMDMAQQLKQNVQAVADRGNLLSDANDEVIVEEWSCEVEELR